MKIHNSITTERVIYAVKESNEYCSDLGFCTKCGDDADGCEPDARNHKCYSCGEMGVFGAEELLSHF